MYLYTIFESPLGPLLLVANQNELVGAYWENQILETKFSKSKSLHRSIKQNLLQKYGESCDFSTSDPLLLETERQLTEYFNKKRTSFKLPLKLTGTEFQKKSWAALTEIPYGSTISYIQQSQFLKSPKSYRAVGTANSKNPISIIIPCHRVIKQNGELSGYAGGVDNKRALLELESTLNLDLN